MDNLIILNDQKFHTEWLHDQYPISVIYEDRINTSVVLQFLASNAHVCRYSNEIWKIWHHCCPHSTFQKLTVSN